MTVDLQYLTGMSQLYQDSNEDSTLRSRFDKFAFLKNVSGISESAFSVNEVVTLNANLHNVIYRDIYSDDLTENEINRVNQSRMQIAEGKSKKFKNAEEYLKSLDDDS